MSLNFKRRKCKMWSEESQYLEGSRYGRKQNLKRDSITKNMRHMGLIMGGVRSVDINISFPMKTCWTASSAIYSSNSKKDIYYLSKLKSKHEITN